MYSNNIIIIIKLKKSIKKEREGVEDENEREERERGERERYIFKFFFSLLFSQIYENRTVGFRRG